MHFDTKLYYINPELYNLKSVLLKLKHKNSTNEFAQWFPIKINVELNSSFEIAEIAVSWRICFTDPTAEHQLLISNQRWICRELHWRENWKQLANLLHSQHRNPVAYLLIKGGCITSAVASYRKVLAINHLSHSYHGSHELNKHSCGISRDEWCVIHPLLLTDMTLWCVLTLSNHGVLVYIVHSEH